MKPLPHSAYFEGILQLRDGNEEIMKFIESTVEEDEKAVITKRDEVKNGYDYYFSSQKYLQSIGKKLQAQFGGELKTSVKLFTRSRNTGKEVYRVTVLFRMHGIKKGAVFEHKGEMLKVLAIGKNIHCKNQENGKRVLLKFSDLG